MANVHVEDMWLTPGPQPNGLQAAPDGLWVIDQQDNHLYKLSYEDGSVLADLPTETYKSSGVTLGGGHVWVASTHNSRLYKLNLDGSTAACYDSPGKGVVAPGSSGPTYPRPHGMEWVDGTLWVAVKPAQRIYQLDPATMKVLHSIPAPSAAPHGLAWDNGTLWCADSQLNLIQRLDPRTGKVLQEVKVPSPEVHGLTIHDGALVFCCAKTRRVCRVQAP